LNHLVLLPLLEKIWDEDKVPNEWKEGLIVKILKKGDTVITGEVLLC
jgi:hypothetical protein